MAKKPDKWDLETEVLVVGTGGSALTAAILAHDNGAGVTVIEKSDKVGGATAVSGGGIWAPGNHHMASDSREDILKYCKRLTKGRAPDELIETYVDTVPEAIKYMEDNTPVELESTLWPDYHPEMEGAHQGDASRMLCPVLFNKNDLGDQINKLRPNPTLGFPMTFNDMAKWESLSKPANIPFDVIAERMEAGFCGLGEALMGSMYRGCLDRGIDPIVNTRAMEFILEEGRVIGVKAKQGDKDYYIRASKAVILASGGFEWNEDLKAQFLPGEITHPNSPPSNEGDGLKMAMALGADLGNMSEIWGQASLQIPGEEYDGIQLNRCSMVERSLPHVIIVNMKGQRFVNEAASYNDMLKSFWILDPNTCDYLNLPAWTIFDEQYHENYAMLTFMPGDDPPLWVSHADTLEKLAQKIGLDPQDLTSNIDRFNRFAEEGVDHDFQRGKSVFDQYWGDKDNKPNPNLGTIAKPPFYALPTFTGAIGTKGGPKINTKGQVMHVSGKPIPGLYAAGNVTAGVSGPAYWGGGGTIGPGMIFGYICGINAAKEK
jgi:3-oxosteroid 1-dehydrogenase